MKENNLDQAKGDRRAIVDLEGQISEMFRSALEQKTLSPDLQSTIAYYKENLSSPVSLDLSGSDITDEALELLNGLPVRELRLWQCEKLTKNCLLFIGKLSSITALDLGNNRWVNDEVLGKIPSNIETLSISASSNITKQGLINLRSTHVRSLDLFGCKNLKDEDLADLPIQFERLDLGMCIGVGEKTMKRLGEMTKLRHLDLSFTDVTDHFVSYLPKHLLSLNLSGCPLSDAALKEIARMENLQELSLTGTRINGEGLSLLPDSLIRLRLHRCLNLSNKWVIPLAARKKLRYLGLERCSQITGEAIEPFSDTKIKVGWQEPQPSHLAMTAFLGQ